MSSKRESARILLIDDEEEFVNTLAERLETRGMATEVAFNGDSGLAVARSYLPDVMIVDLKMPGMGGLEVLRAAGREHPFVPVIILTGHGSEADRSYALEHGAFCYLSKPVAIENLMQHIQSAWMKKRVDEKYHRSSVPPGL